MKESTYPVGGNSIAFFSLFSKLPVNTPCHAEKSKLLSWLGGMLLCGAALALLLPQEAKPSRLTAVSLGAAREVSGSLHLLDTGNGLWMIDCGAIIEDEDADRELPETAAASRSDSRAEVEKTLPHLPARASRGFSIPQSLPPEAKKASAVFLTHAHADHLGRLPLLVEQGYDGPIYTTRITASLAVPMLRVLARCDRARVRHWRWSKSRLVDAMSEGKSLFLHWRRCLRLQKMPIADLEQAKCTLDELLARFAPEYPKLKAVLCEECIKAEIGMVSRLFQTVAYDGLLKVAPGVKVTFLDARHISGSASVLLEVELGGRRGG